MLRRFRHLPQSLQVLFLTYVAGPLAFLAAWLINVAGLVGLPAWYLGLTSVVYGLGPWVIAVFLILRQRAFLVCFALWGLALIATAFSSPQGQPLAFVVVHATFAMTMVMTALVLVNRDLLLPLMFPERRGWRLAPRVSTNHRIKLRIPRLNREATVMMEDCSMTGLAGYGPEDSMQDAFESALKGEPVVMTCAVARKTFEIPMFCMWQARAAGLVRIGLKAHDGVSMSQLFEAVRPVQPRTIPGRLREMWVRPSLRRVLNYLLAIGLMGLMLLPPLFLDNGPGKGLYSALKRALSSEASH